MSKKKEVIMPTNYPTNYSILIEDSGSNTKDIICDISSNCDNLCHVSLYLHIKQMLKTLRNMYILHSDMHTLCTAM